jgi:hypothetical protein
MQNLVLQLQIVNALHFLIPVLTITLFILTHVVIFFVLLDMKKPILENFSSRKLALLLYKTTTPFAVHRHSMQARISANL